MKKGIYCIEGLWDHGNIQDQSTVLPILDLLEKRGYCNYIYHDCATKSELEYFLEKWKNKKIMAISLGRTKITVYREGRYIEIMMRIINIK